MKYIDAEKLIAEIKGKIAEIEKEPAPVDRETILLQMCKINAFREVLSVISRLKKNSLQQEPTPDTDAFHTELVNLLKTYRIGEETARTMADRIADTYGVQRYMDGLCDGLNEEDTKQEQPEVDLKKEVVDFWDIVYGKDRRCTRSINIYDFQSFARHFYELRNRELEEAARRVYESWMGGTMDDVRRDMVELGRVINARKV